MQLHQLQRTHKNKTSKRVGRGGKRGKTSGRGHKGQKARAGHHIRPVERDIIKKLPKKRGHGRNRARTVNDARIVAIPVNIAALEKAFVDGSIVTPQSLREKKVIRTKKGVKPVVKILGNGVLSKKLTISRCLVSKSALEQINKVGGKVTTLPVSLQASAK